MRVLCIDRFEGTFAVCEELSDRPLKPKDIRYFGIEKTELPKGAGEGSVLRIGDDGTIALDEKETALRRAKISKMQKDVWE